MSNQQQQPPNGSPTPQVPDQRFELLQRELRELRDQNQQLRGSVDHMAQAQRGNQPPQPSAFKPEVEQAIDAKFAALLQPIQHRFAQTIGMMRDETDQAKFENKYSRTNLSEYLPKVEEKAKEMQSRGQWAPREEILKQVYFDETGKKANQPTPQAPPQQAQPTYDTYTNQWVDTTGKQVAPPQQAIAPPGEVPQPAPQIPPPVPQYSQAPQSPPSGYQPQPPVQQWIPQLPPSTPPPSAPSTGQVSSPVGLDLTATPQALEAWANKYGDQPL